MGKKVKHQNPEHSNYSSSKSSSLKLAIIIPAYNEEKYIGSCLCSLREQSDKDFETIVVDNNSTDNTSGAAKTFASSLNLKVVKCKQQGISASRNFGAQATGAEILCFIDSDATISKDWVRNAKMRMENRDAISGYNTFSAPNLLIYAYYNIYNLLAFTILIVSNMIGKYFVAGNNMAIRRDLLTKAGFFPNYVAEDIKLSRNLRKMGKLRIGFGKGMGIVYSPRRFQKYGFLKTLWLWLKSVSEQIPEDNYKAQY